MSTFDVRPPYETDPTIVDLLDNLYQRSADDKVKHQQEIAVLMQKVEEAENEQKKLARLVMQSKVCTNCKNLSDLNGELHVQLEELTFSNMSMQRVRDTNDKLMADKCYWHNVAKRLEADSVVLKDTNESLSNDKEWLHTEMAKRFNLLKERETANKRLCMFYKKLLAKLKERDNAIVELKRSNELLIAEKAELQQKLRTQCRHFLNGMWEIEYIGKFCGKVVATITPDNKWITHNVRGNGNSSGACYCPDVTISDFMYDDTKHEITFKNQCHLGGIHTLKIVNDNLLKGSKGDPNGGRLGHSDSDYLMVTMRRKNN